MIHVDDGPWEPTAAGMEDPHTEDEQADDSTLENNLGEQQQEYHDSRPTEEVEVDRLQQEDPWQGATATITRQPPRLRPSAKGK